MDFSQYIKPELLILVPVLFILGEIIKHTQALKDNWIPAVLGIVGILLSAVYVWATSGFSLLMIFVAITQGLLVAGMSVYVDQIIKQSIEKKEPIK